MKPHPTLRKACLTTENILDTTLLWKCVASLGYGLSPPRKGHSL